MVAVAWVWIMFSVCSNDSGIEITYDSDGDWDTLANTGNTLGTTGRCSWDNSDVTGAGGGSFTTS